MEKDLDQLLQRGGIMVHASTMEERNGIRKLGAKVEIHTPALVVTYADDNELDKVIDGLSSLLLENCLRTCLRLKRNKKTTRQEISKGLFVELGN